jgi:hypothetical protein
MANAAGRFGIIDPRTGVNLQKSIPEPNPPKEISLAQLPPMTALCRESPMNPNPLRSRKIQNETHYRACGCLDTP